MKYSSLEQYLKASLKHQKPTFGDFRDFLRSEERRLNTACSYLGFSLISFKKNGRYCITEEVADLFDYVHKYLNEKYYWSIKHGDFALIPEGDLVRLRTLLSNALYSIEMPEVNIEKTIASYNATVGNLPLYRTWKINAMTSDAIDFLKEEYKNLLSDIEWEQFTDELHWEFISCWRPILFKISKDSLNKFLKELGKEEIHDLEDWYDLNIRADGQVGE